MATIGTAVTLLAQYVAGAIAVLMALVLVIWGVFAFGMVPSLQYRVISLAGPGGALAQSLPASAVNAGIAFGSIAGGMAVGSFTASSGVITGLIIAVIAVPVAWATGLLKPPTVRKTATNRQPRWNRQPVLASRCASRCNTRATPGPPGPPTS